MPNTNRAFAGPKGRGTIGGKTVVIADDDPIIVDYLSLRCRHLGLRVETAGDGLRTVLRVGKERPDLLILDLNLPNVEGFRVVERLADPKFAPVPVIILTGRSDEDAKQRCQDLNVHYVHKSEDTWADLEPLIFDVLHSAPAQPKAAERRPIVTPRVLLVDEDRQRLLALAQSLQKYQVDVILGSSAVQGFLLALKDQPDLVIAEYDMEQGSGNYLLGRIKSSPSTQHIPVIIFSGKPMDKGHEHAVQRDLRGRGQAAAFLAGCLNPAIFAAEIRKHLALAC